MSISSSVKSSDLSWAYEMDEWATRISQVSVFENMAKANLFSKYDYLFLERAEMYRIAA